MSALKENNTSSTTGACETCLRRSHLITYLSPFIQTHRDSNPGTDVRELLRLDDEQLVERVAPGIDDRLTAAFEEFSVDAVEKKMDDVEVWAVCQHDDRYPVQLAGSGKDAPAVLYGTGDIRRLGWLEPAETVAVVGTRRSTGYGLEVAGTISFEIARSGRTVLSGMALGVDGAAHRGGLQGGRTVAVLSVGPEQTYPRSHSRMHQTIKERGLILSEMPPGVGETPTEGNERVHRWTFPARNRIVAALAGATIVTEASVRSGSMITAGMAKDLGRPLGAVPAPVTSAAQGTNQLIREGAALIRNGEDAIELL